MLSSRRLSAPIDLAPMPDLDDLYHDLTVVHGVHNPVITYAQAILRIVSRKLLACWRTWIIRKVLNDVNNLPPHCCTVYGLKFLRC